MFDFFNTIGGYLSTFWKLVENFCLMLSVIINVLIDGVSLPIQFATFFPGFLGASILIFVVLYVIKFILAR